MQQDQLIEQMDKLIFQVKMLGLTIDSEVHPVEALILAKNWNEKDIDKAHDIFEKWDEIIEQGGPLKKYEFESDFRDKFGYSYQGVKPIVNAFYKNHQWTNVCREYVSSHGQSPPVEFWEIAKDIHESRSE